MNQPKKITQSFIKEVKKVSACKWHDKTWHDFMMMPEVMAVVYAMTRVDFKSDLKEIQKEAISFLAVMQD